jgi:predicted enzyme related to lactoylglutathione lyase
MMALFFIHQEQNMIKGLRTVTYPVPDLDKAKAWYSQVFGTTPYFDQPFYVGFNIGGFELGLLPDGQPGTQGSVTYWGVDGIEAEVERIIQLGGTLHHPLTDVGDGIRTVELLDPFGNQIGLIDNPHFDTSKVA